LKLRDLQCDQAQGFFYSPPVPAEQLVRMLKAGPLAVPGD
jgi:diguanylate cyclase